MHNKSILLINGHPAYGRSFSNKIIVEKLRDEFGDNLLIHELAKNYPDYVIDVAQEQEALQKAEVVVWEFPFFWYSVPAILKKWVDDVFSYGFAYGPGGDKLRGKKILYSFTTGGDALAYTRDGHNRHSIEEMATPLLSIANFVGMRAELVYTTGMLYVEGKEGELKKRLVEHSQRLIEACKR